MAWRGSKESFWRPITFSNETSDLPDEKSETIGKYTDIPRDESSPWYGHLGRPRPLIIPFNVSRSLSNSQGLGPVYIWDD